MLVEAELVVLPITALCEFAWVAARRYRLSSSEIAEAIRVLLSAENALTDGTAADAGLAVLDAGGDFADGVIAHQGYRFGAEAFVSFDRQAVRLIGRDHDTRLLD